MSVTGDGAYDRDDVYAEVAARYPEAAVVVPPRANAVPSGLGAQNAVVASANPGPGVWGQFPPLSG